MHVGDVDINILIEDKVFYIVLTTIQQEADLVDAVLYVIIILVFHNNSSGIKSLKSHWVQSLKYCDYVTKYPLCATAEILRPCRRDTFYYLIIRYPLKCGDWRVNHVIKWRDYCFSNGPYVAISMVDESASQWSEHCQRGEQGLSILRRQNRLAFY
jgi:hypothetical protein